jgi:hypothetical protein
MSLKFLKILLKNTEPKPKLCIKMPKQFFLSVFGYSKEILHKKTIYLHMKGAKVFTPFSSKGIKDYGNNS